MGTRRAVLAVLSLLAAAGVCAVAAERPNVPATAASHPIRKSRAAPELRRLRAGLRALPQPRAADQRMKDLQTKPQPRLLP